MYDTKDKRRRIEMNSLKLKENLYWVGIEDFELKTFDIIMTTEYGSSYNSYLLKGSEKTALVDTEKTKFFDEYLARVEEVVPLNRLDYIIMNHTEPDHADGIGILLEKNPEITVVGTNAAINNLKQITNRSDFKSIVVKDRETLSLGDITLEFHVLPNLHWPDTMWTYAKELETLFTCDSFGCHFASEEVLRSLVRNEAGYWDAAKYYYDCIFAPFSKPFMQNGVARIESLKVNLLCPGHGPVLDSHIEEIVERYREWSQPAHFEKKTVIMPYVSAYGYTGMIAEAIAEGIRKAGDIDVRIHDMEQDDVTSVQQEIIRADGLLCGTPTIVGEALPPIFDTLSHLYPVMMKGKYAGAFGSYGWSGEGVPHITERLKQLNFKVVDGLRIKFKPSEGDLEAARAFGFTFGMMVLGREVELQ